MYSKYTCCLTSSYSRTMSRFLVSPECATMHHMRTGGIRTITTLNLDPVTDPCMRTLESRVFIHYRLVTSLLWTKTTEFAVRPEWKPNTLIPIIRIIAGIIQSQVTKNPLHQYRSSRTDLEVLPVDGCCSEIMSPGAVLDQDDSSRKSKLSCRYLCICRCLFSSIKWKFCLRYIINISLIIFFSAPHLNEALIRGRN